MEYARTVGIAGTDAAALAALRALPAATPVAGVDFESVLPNYAGGPRVPGFASATVDGRLDDEPPEAALRAGRQAPVPVLLGTNDHDLAPSVAQTKDAVFAQFGPRAARARALYDPAGAAGLAALVQAVAADRTMAEPTRFLAEATTRAGQPAYRYLAGRHGRATTRRSTGCSTSRTPA